MHQYSMILRTCGILVAVVSVVSFVALSTQANHDGGMTRMALDMDPSSAPANTATNLGPTEFCARVNENDMLDADEDQVDSLSLDLVAVAIPASAPIAGYSYTLNYDEAGLTLQAHNPNFLLGSRAGSSVWANTTVPDNDGSGEWGGSAIDLAVGTSEVGSGVLDRLTIVSDPGAAAGVRLLALSDASHFDEAGTYYGPHQLDNAWLALGTSCPGAPPAPTTPTPSPSPTPSPRPSATPRPPPPPIGDVLRVPADFPSIQAAIDAANDGDRVLVGPGTYHENLTVAGKSVDLVSESGPASTIIDGGGLAEVVSFRAGSIASLIHGFTIVDGYGDFGGGGVEVASAGASIVGNWIMDNRACGGVGINVAGYSVVSISNNIIKNNRFFGCTGATGGGISIAFSSGEILNNVIDGNSADTGGGGIELFLAYKARIEGNIIVNNTAHSGAGVWAVNEYAPVGVVQNFFAANQAQTGSAIKWGLWSGLIANNTMLNNGSSAFLPERSTLMVGSAGDTVVANNIIVTASGEQAIYCEVRGGTPIWPTFANNDVLSQTRYAGGCPDPTGANGNISVEPMWDGAAFKLGSDSPLIDAGNPTSSGLPHLDFEGDCRYTDGDSDGTAVVDIGYDEYSPEGECAVPPAPSPSPSPSPGPDASFLSFDSQPGDWIGHGFSQRVTGEESLFIPRVHMDQRRVTVGVFPPDGHWSIDLAAPDGSQLLTGTYEGATHSPDLFPNLPALNFSGTERGAAGRACSSVAGRFEVHEAVYHPTGDIRRLRANFEQHCNGGLPALFGEVQIVDTDGDRVVDSGDNCPTIANGGQENFDGDASGNACDIDDDNDGFTDSSEAGVLLCNGTNNDTFDDAVVDDGCPGGPLQQGAYSEAQFRISTGSLDPCGTNGWPLDLVSSGLSANKFDISDLGSFVAPLRRIGKNPNHTAFSSRWDLSPGPGAIPSQGWINVLDLATTTSGTTGFPPMLSGSRAMNRVCPFPP